jgi:sulfur carrier protein
MTDWMIISLLVDETMNIIVNGKNLACSDGLSVHELLLELDLKPDAIVVERNAEILQRSAYATTRVSEGDSFEFIHFVGGG